MGRPTFCMNFVQKQEKKNRPDGEELFVFSSPEPLDPPGHLERLGHHGRHLGLLGRGGRHRRPGPLGVHPDDGAGGAVLGLRRPDVARRLGVRPHVSQLGLLVRVPLTGVRVLGWVGWGMVIQRLM